MLFRSLAEPKGRRLLPDESSGEFVPDSPGSTAGHLLFLREQTLMSQAFDLTSLQLSGEPSAVAEQVAFTNTSPQIAASASSTGTVVFLTNGRPDRQLVWRDRSGKQLERIVNIGTGAPSLSLAPNETRVAFKRTNAQSVVEAALSDIGRHQEMRLFTPPLAPSVVWSPDATRVLFSATIAGTTGLYVRDANGGREELLLRAIQNQRVASDWSHDGRMIVYTEVDPKTRGDIWLLPASPNASPVPLLRTPASESQGHISPDGRWLAYWSDEADRDQIRVRPFAILDGAAATSWAVPAEGPTLEPFWRADGKELFYLQGIAGTRRWKVMAVSVGTTPNPLGQPTMLFEFQTNVTSPQLNGFSYASSADGQRFLVSEFATELQPTLDVILN